MSESYLEIEKLLKCIKRGVSAYHTVAYAVEELKTGGFEELIMGQKWKLQPGKGYYVKVFETALFAFSVPQKYYPGMPVQIATAHNDWPGIRIKPFPELTYKRYEKLNIEVYGGAVFHTWLNRPLSIAGAVCVKDGARAKTALRLVDFKRPMAVIPSLAKHYNREVNSHLEVNAQQDLQPLLDVVSEKWEHDGYFYRLLAEELQVAPEDILSFDLGFYILDEPVLYGEHTTMLSAPRLDNLTSVQACLSAITANRNADTFQAIMLFDNEEVGSHTKQGADSVVPARLLEQVICGLGGDHMDYMNSTLNGLLLSCDVAHAVHPNQPGLSDPIDQVFPGDGVSFKLNSTQRYATDVQATGLAEAICQEENIPHKPFCNRADQRGGSTLGSKISSQLGIRTLDLGVAILAMHCAKELMAAEDQIAFTRLVKSMLAYE